MKHKKIIYCDSQYISTRISTESKAKFFVLGHNNVGTEALNYVTNRINHTDYNFGICFGQTSHFFNITTFVVPGTDNSFFVTNQEGKRLEIHNPVSTENYYLIDKDIGSGLARFIFINTEILFEENSKVEMIDINLPSENDSETECDQTEVISDPEDNNIFHFDEEEMFNALANDLTSDSYYTTFFEWFERALTIPKEIEMVFIVSKKSPLKLVSISVYANKIMELIELCGAPNLIYLFNEESMHQKFEYLYNYSGTNQKIITFINCGCISEPVNEFSSPFFDTQPLLLSHLEGSFARGLLNLIDENVMSYGFMNFEVDDDNDLIQTFNVFSSKQINTSEYTDLVCAIVTSENLVRVINQESSGKIPSDISLERYITVLKTYEKTLEYHKGNAKVIKKLVALDSEDGQSLFFDCTKSCQLRVAILKTQTILKSIERAKQIKRALRTLIDKLEFYNDCEENQNEPINEPINE